MAILGDYAHYAFESDLEHLSTLHRQMQEIVRIRIGNVHAL